MGAGLGTTAKLEVLTALAAGDAAATVALDGLGPALYPLLEMGGRAGVELAAEHMTGGARGWLLDDRYAEHVTASAQRVAGSWPWLPASMPDIVVILGRDRAWVMTDGITAVGEFAPCALHASGHSAIHLDGVPKASFHDPRGVRRARARARLWCGGLLLGIGQAALEHIIGYTTERHAFGKPVAHHQGVAFTIAGLATNLEAATAACRAAAWVLDDPATRDAVDPTQPGAAAYVCAIDAALRLTQEGVQLLGGHGYMRDHPVEKWMREARTLAQLFGGRDEALHDAAGAVMTQPSHPWLQAPAWENA